MVSLKTIMLANEGKSSSRYLQIVSLALAVVALDIPYLLWRDRKMASSAMCPSITCHGGNPRVLAIPDRFSRRLPNASGIKPGDLGMYGSSSMT